MNRSAWLLASGPRTNPWFQECGLWVIQGGDVLGDDTGLVGPFEMCADMSHAWLLGDKKSTDEQKRFFNAAHEHVATNAQLFALGVSFKEQTFESHQLPEEFIERRYGRKMQGLGFAMNGRRPSTPTIGVRALLIMS